MTTPTTPTIADCLEYAKLQMAAEAFLVNDNGTLKNDAGICWIFLARG